MRARAGAPLPPFLCFGPTLRGPTSLGPTPLPLFSVLVFLFGPCFFVPFVIFCLQCIFFNLIPTAVRFFCPVPFFCPHGFFFVPGPAVCSTQGRVLKTQKQRTVSQTWVEKMEKKTVVRKKRLPDKWGLDCSE